MTDQVRIAALIVDDEEFARENLRMLLEDYCPSIAVCGAAKNAEEARRMVEEFNPELIFLDIMMPGEDGFSFLAGIENRSFEVIFTTAFRDFVLNALRENAADYLEKPIDPDELIRATTRAAERIRNKQTKPVSPDRLHRILQDIALTNTVEKTVIPTRDGFAVVRDAEIIHLEASENYTTLFCTGNKKYVSSKSIKVFEDRLNPAMFMRVHKSHIINLAHHLREFSRSEGNLAVMTDGSRIPVARRKLQDFLERLGLVS